MNYRHVGVFVSTALSSAAFLFGQVTLNPTASRVVGQPRLQFSTGNPNLIEGRELYSPQGVVVDTTADPPILYVSDTGNNRVMVWNNAAHFANGAFADLIIGQKDAFSTFAQGPGTAATVGLSSPTGLAVKDGNLYVVDTGNNRILRFPKPTTQPGGALPDMVIGQPNFNSKTANQGAALPTEKTLALAVGSNLFRSCLVFDSAGNLWLTDPGNNRMLRYPAQAISQGASGPSADLVIGQVNFTSVDVALPANVTGQQVKDRLQIPAGLAFDSSGRLFVSDGLSRVLVFAPPFSSGMLARRVMGVILQPKTGQPPVTQIQIDRTAMIDPEGIFMVNGNNAGLIDASSNRILLFDPFDQWPDEGTMFSPQARNVVGQLNDFTTRATNNGQPEASENTLSGPVAAVLTASELYVADAGNHRVVVLPQQGNYFGAATRVAGQDQFNFSSANLIEGREFDFTITTRQGNFADAAIVVDQVSDTPHLYVADTYNNRVLGFKDVRQVRPGDRADVVIGQPDMFRSLCNYPANDVDKPTQSSLCRPAGVAVDSDGNLWVTDSANGRVLRFPNPFTHQATLPQADLVLGQTSFTSKITDATARTMSSPYGLTFAGDNGLLVSDQALNRVLFFPKTGGGYTNGMTATKVFGQPNFTSADPSSPTNPEDNRMRGPHHVAADTDARLYVADTGNNRVLIFDQVGNVPATEPRAVVTLPGLSSPRGIYVSPQTGEIWITDTNNARSLRYPRFDQLPFGSYQPNATPIPSASAALAVTQDQYGDLLVADAANRIAIFYPGVTAVNGAHYLPSRALAPGMVASLFPTGGNFGGSTKSFTELPNPLPLPTDLADIQVLVDNTPAPLYFVSPQQINLFVPNNASTSGTAEFQVQRKSTGQILASGPVQMNVASPGLFTVNSNGTGQVAALNQDNTVNSPTNQASRGSVIQMFGTGQGLVPGAPPDGEAPKGAVPTPDNPRIIIGNCFVDDPACTGDSGQLLQYSGLAPGLVGVWQINVKIPSATAPASNVPVVVVFKNIPSNGGDPKRVATTIAVKQ